MPHRTRYHGSSANIKPARQNRHNTLLCTQPLIEVESIPAQWASTRIARLEPLEQTRRVEEVLAGRATLGGQGLLGVDDLDTIATVSTGLKMEGTGRFAHRIANTTLARARECTCDVLTPC